MLIQESTAYFPTVLAKAKCLCSTITELFTVHRFLQNKFRLEIFSTLFRGVKPVFHLANLAGDVVSVCRQPIKLLFPLFARTNSPSGKLA